MRVVLDTNVLVSAFMHPDRVPGQVLDLVPTGAFTCLYDSRILAEYEEVLGRPHFGFKPENLQAFVTLLWAVGEEVEGPFPKLQLPDKSDEKFLEVAWAGLADILVIGNLKHFPAKQTGLIKVMSPKEFLDLKK